MMATCNHLLILPIGMIICIFPLPEVLSATGFTLMSLTVKFDGISKHMGISGFAYEETVHFSNFWQRKVFLEIQTLFLSIICTHHLILALN
jgi:hypothetical protein